MQHFRLSRSHCSGSFPKALRIPRFRVRSRGLKIQFASADLQRFHLRRYWSACCLSSTPPKTGCGEASATCADLFGVTRCRLPCYARVSGRISCVLWLAPRRSREATATYHRSLAAHSVRGRRPFKGLGHRHPVVPSLLVGALFAALPATAGHRW